MDALLLTSFGSIPVIKVPLHDPSATTDSRRNRRKKIRPPVYLQTRPAKTLACLSSLAGVLYARRSRGGGTGASRSPWNLQEIVEGSARKLRRHRCARYGCQGCYGPIMLVACRARLENNKKMTMLTNSFSISKKNCKLCTGTSTMIVRAFSDTRKSHGRRSGL